MANKKKMSKNNSQSSSSIIQQSPSQNIHLQKRKVKET